MQIIGFGSKALGCPCWTESAGVKKHLAPERALHTSRVPKPQLLRLTLLASVRAGHSSCLSPLSLPRREDIVALSLTLCILSRGDENPWIHLSPIFWAPKNHHCHLCWLLPGNKTQLFVPPASHMTRTLQTSVQNVTFLSQSLLTEQQLLVAQTVLTIFDE